MRVEDTVTSEYAAAGYGAGRRYVEREILTLVEKLKQALAGYERLQVETREKTSAPLLACRNPFDSSCGN